LFQVERDFDVKLIETLDPVQVLLRVAQVSTDEASVLELLEHFDVLKILEVFVQIQVLAVALLAGKQAFTFLHGFIDKANEHLVLAGSAG